jgi:hypothetical protein
VSEPVTIGRATLYCGDCREILPLIGRVGHIITDPPYSEALHALHDESARRSTDKADRQVLGYSGLTPEMVLDLAGIFHEVAKGWIAWMTDHELSLVVRSAMSQQGRATFPPVVFHHPGRSVRLSGDGPSSWTDYIMTSRPAALRRWGTLPGGYVASAGWNDKARMGGKPTRLMRLMVRDYSRPKEVVCDPFMGAGTTGVACMLEDRDFIGVEIDPDAFDIACKRIEDAQRQGDLFLAGVAA